MNDSYALILTGEVLPGFAPESVWPALAAYFRMEPERLRSQLLARAPVTIKQGDDLGKLQTLQAGAAAVGAETELCALDGQPPLFVLLGNAPRGPVPRVLVEERVEHGLWPDGIMVAEVGSSTWAAYRSAPPPPRDEPLPQEDVTARGSVLVTPIAPAAGARAPSMPLVGSTSLPAGAAIHAGFWRRCAALLIDSFIVGIGGAVVQGVFGLGIAFSEAARPAAFIGITGLAMLVMFVGQWLYFALFECGRLQATPGKLALGIKVVDDLGRRVDFGRASGRYFGKILSSLILNIGYLMAGWTARKQALHDLLAGTLVVFADVQPGQPLPTTRPPMPWYGWLLNILALLGLLMLVMAGWYFAHAMADLASGALRGGQGF
jgi:uncharacterized RDD family membrane protein YckC